MASNTLETPVSHQLDPQRPLTADLDVDGLVDRLAREILSKHKNHPSSSRLLIGVAGVPGSGKSTLAVPLAAKLGELSGGARGKAICVGMDGWHHTREELSRFPDPDEAKRRRGAAFTFNAKSFHSFIQSLRSSPSSPEPIPFPLFSHALKDPSPSPDSILPEDGLIVIEGLYLFLDCSPWSEACALLDERIFLATQPEVCRRRLIARHLESGVEATLERAENRVDSSDMKNGEEIRAKLIPPTITVEVIEGEDGVALFGVALDSREE